MVKYKELNETDKKVIKFAYFTKLLVRLSRLNEQDIPLQSSNMAYDRGSTRWSVERADEDTLYLRLFTKGSNISKSVYLTIQDRELLQNTKLENAVYLCTSLSSTRLQILYLMKMVILSMKATTTYTF